MVSYIYGQEDLRNLSGAGKYDIYSVWKSTYIWGRISYLFQKMIDSMWATEISPKGSQYHRMVKVGRGISRLLLSSSTLLTAVILNLLPKTIYSSQVLGILKDFHSFSGNLVQNSNKASDKKIFLLFLNGISCFYFFLSIMSFPIIGHQLKEPVSVLFNTNTHQSGFYIHCWDRSTRPVESPCFHEATDKVTDGHQAEYSGLLKWQLLTMYEQLNQSSSLCADCVCRLYYTCMFIESWQLVLSQASLGIQDMCKALTNIVKELWDTSVFLEKQREGKQDRQGCLRCH